MNKAETTSKQKESSEAVPADRQQAAQYIAVVSHELSGIADGAGLPFLQYLLDMTAEEAMKQGGTPARGRTRERVKSPGQ